MRFLSTLILIGGLGYGVYWINQNQPELRDQALNAFHTTTFQAFETSYTPRQLMDKERSGLLKGPDYHFLEPTLSYVPYLLMEVKYTNTTHTTEEGVLLWDLSDGEMVIDTESWEKTHGFADCIHMGAGRQEHLILSTIQDLGGKADRNSLLKSLSIEPHLLDVYLDRARMKKLITQHDHTYRIHLNHPKIHVSPSTEINHPIVTRPCRHKEKGARQFSVSKIKKTAEAAFGGDFAIRSTQEVYLPVYSITVQRPDGTIYTTHWNGVNGKHLPHSSFVE